MNALLPSLLRLTRFGNLLIVALSQYCAVGFLIDPAHLTDWHLAVLTSSTLLIAGAGYIINDYYDVKIDLINKPERVVIGKSITRRYAILFHTVMNFFGVGLGLALDWRVGLLNLTSAFFLWLYSNNLKRLPFIGNFMVGLLTAAALAVVMLPYGYHATVMLYAVFAFAMTLIREIIKDMEDLKGDNTFGCRTLPIVWGMIRTKFLLYLLIATFACSVWVINRFVMALPITYFELFLFLPLGLLTLYLIRADTRKDYQRLSLACKIIMLLGVASMAFF